MCLVICWPRACARSYDRGSPVEGEVPAFGEGEEVVPHGPFVGAGLLAGVADAGAFEGHAAGVVTDAADGLDLVLAEALLGEGTLSGLRS